MEEYAGLEYFNENVKKVCYQVTSEDIRQEDLDLEKYGNESVDKLEFLSLHEAEKVAEENGWIVKYPKCNQLFLDYDSSEELEKSKKPLSLILRWYPGSVYTVTESKTPGHYHVVLDFPEMMKFTNLERIALQAICGSDFRKEFISFERYFNKEFRPIILFEKE